MDSTFSSRYQGENDLALQKRLQQPAMSAFARRDAYAGTCRHRSRPARDQHGGYIRVGIRLSDFRISTVGGYFLDALFIELVERDPPALIVFFEGQATGQTLAFAKRLEQGAATTQRAAAPAIQVSASNEPRPNS